MQEVPVPGEPPSPSHLIVVALGEEQGTELPVECCLVGLLPVLGQLVHVGLGQLERLLSQVVLAVPVANVQQPWGMQRELLRELQEPSHAAAPGSRGGTHTGGALPAQQNCPALPGVTHTHTWAQGRDFSCWRCCRILPIDALLHWTTLVCCLCVLFSIKSILPNTDEIPFPKPCLTHYKIPSTSFPKGGTSNSHSKYNRAHFPASPHFSLKPWVAPSGHFCALGLGGGLQKRFSHTIPHQFQLPQERPFYWPKSTTTQTPPALPLPTPLPSHLKDRHPNTANNTQHWWNPLLFLQRSHSSSLWHLFSIKVKNSFISAGWCSLALTRCIWNGCVWILQAPRAELDSQPGQLFLLHGKHLPVSRHGILVN